MERGEGVVYAVKRAVRDVARGIDPFPFRSKLRGKIAHISFRATKLSRVRLYFMFEKVTQSSDKRIL